MNVRELHAILSRFLDKHGDDPVVIRRSDPSMGAVAMTGVHNAGPGFDWEHGKFMIFPDEPLFKHDDETQIRALRQQIDGLVWENGNLKRSGRQQKGG